MFDDGELGDFELSVEDRLLATSPCLYSIRLQPTSQQRSRSFNPQAVKQLVQGANPHLKVIEICRKPREKARPFQRRTPDQRLREWSGIPSAKFAPRAALESLQLASTYVSTIDVWHSSADLVQLRTLRLGRVDLAVLRWIEANSCHGTCVFPQLKCLELDVARSGDETASDAAWVTQTVLRCLPPLEDLTLNGRTFGDYSNDTTEAILAAVLQHHGPSLLSFSIPQTLNSPPIIKTAGDALRVMATCPRLVHLQVSIIRSEGDQKELAIYQQLGAHPRLQSISLTLDCTEEVLKTPLADHWDKAPWNEHGQICNGHVRKSLMNCALDGSLATSIFHQCAAAKPPGATPLKSMELKISNAGIFRLTHTNEDARGFPILLRPLNPVFEHLGRNTWTVSPHPNDARQGEVVATKRECRSYYGTNLDRMITLGPVESSFRTLWPEGTTGDCRDDWHSFPLAT